MEKENPKEPFEKYDGEYIGNIWGWKFSFISLGIIVAMLLLMLFRYSVNNNQPPSSEKQSIAVEKDSSSIEDQSID